MERLTFINTVRGLLEQTQVTHIADTQTELRLLSEDARVLTMSDGRRAFVLTTDEKLANALQGAGAHPASAPGGGTAWGYIKDSRTKTHEYDLWLPIFDEDALA